MTTSTQLEPDNPSLKHRARNWWASIGLIQLYFILSGLFTLLGVIFVFWLIHRKAVTLSLASQVTYAAWMVVDLAYIYTGIRIRKLIAQTPQSIIWLLILNAGFYILVIAWSHLDEILYGTWRLNTESLTFQVPSLFITWYFFCSVRHIVTAQAQSMGEPNVA